MNKRGKFRSVCKRCGKPIDRHRFGKACKDSWAIPSIERVPRGQIPEPPHPR